MFSAHVADNHIINYCTDKTQWDNPRYRPRKSSIWLTKGQSPCLNTPIDCYEKLNVFTYEGDEL